jgi:flagellar biosynthesis GTPase FlhF
MMGNHMKIIRFRKVGSAIAILAMPVIIFGCSGNPSKYRPATESPTAKPTQRPTPTPKPTPTPSRAERREREREAKRQAKREAAREREAEREQQAKQESEDERRTIFKEIVAAEDRAQQEADQEYPPEVGVDVMPGINRNRELEEKYRAQVAEQHGLSKEELRKIVVEGATKRWPLQ